MITLTPFARLFRFTVGLAALPFASLAHGGAPGSVYTISNAADANRVLAFSRGADGELQPPASFPTGGKGTGAGLGSQGALALSENGRWLLAVNAGSDDISVFEVRRDALVLTDIASSGGKRPISLTIADNLVYVLNAGGAAGASDNISGFYLSEKGRLWALPGSTQPLSGANVAPAEVSFGLRGDVLVVSEKGTSRLDGFRVDDTGRAGPVVSRPSAGAVPFGFSISSKGFLFVSEAASSALSSYQLHADGTINLVTGSLINQQAAACWTALSKDAKYAYTANAATNTISGYRVAADGSVTLLNTTGLTASADNHPLDLTVSHDGRFLYSLNTTSRSLVAFRIGADGGLKRVASIDDLPAASAGLVAR